MEVQDVGKERYRLFSGCLSRAHMGGSCLGMSRDISTRSKNHGFVGKPWAIIITLHICD